MDKDGDGVIVTFSDGTTRAYVVEELLESRPFQEPTAKSPRSPSNRVDCILVG